MKVGITSPKIEKLYCNGVRFNTIIWYDFLEKCGFDVTFLVNEDTTYKNYKFYNYMNLWEKVELPDKKDSKSLQSSVISQDVSTETSTTKKTDKPSLYRLKSDFEDEYKKELLNYDVVFNVGLHDKGLFDLLKKRNIKIIYVMLGSTYHNDVHSLVDNTFKTSLVTTYFDEIWISPHFKYCQEYYKVRYKTDKVYLCPYFWRDDMFTIDGSTREQVLESVRKNTDKELEVAIVEPNIEQAKNCLIPFTICEKAHEELKKVRVFNSVKLKDQVFFKNYLISSNLHRKGKLSVESRFPLLFILTEYCNCVVSYVEDCDLNYVFLECFYLGVPLIHNSPMLKDYGYYYPRLEISKGVEQIKHVMKNHDREKYIQKHQPILDKYSIDNPQYIKWVKDRIEHGIDNGDCE